MLHSPIASTITQRTTTQRSYLPVPVLVSHMIARQHTSRRAWVLVAVLLCGVLLINWSANRFLETPYTLSAHLTIVTGREDEFLATMEIDSAGCRDKEPACLFFAVSRVVNTSNEFVMWEVYTNEAAFALHSQQPHFEPWHQFKESGGVQQQLNLFADAVFSRMSTLTEHSLEDVDSLSYVATSEHLLAVA